MRAGRTLIQAAGFHLEAMILYSCNWKAPVYVHLQSKALTIVSLLQRWYSFMLHSSSPYGTCMECCWDWRLRDFAFRVERHKPSWLVLYSAHPWLCCHTVNALARFDRSAPGCPQAPWDNHQMDGNVEAYATEEQAGYVPDFPKLVWL